MIKLIMFIGVIYMVSAITTTLFGWLAGALITGFVAAQLDKGM